MVKKLPLNMIIVLDLFCRFLFSSKHEGFTCIAHNSKGFDCIFIQQWLIKNRPNADTHVIHSGTKVMQLTLEDYKIWLIDSLNYFQMPFGLNQSVYSKPDFFHIYLTHQKINRMLVPCQTFNFFP